MDVDPQGSEERPKEEHDDSRELGPQVFPGHEDESFQIMIDKARRLVAAELEITQMRSQILESNLTISEAQLELAERQLDQLIAENQRLQQENEALKCRLGESA